MGSMPVHAERLDMETTGQDRTAVQGENQFDATQAQTTAQVKAPPPVEPPPPIIWPSPLTVPHHATDIRDWGIKE